MIGVSQVLTLKGGRLKTWRPRLCCWLWKKVRERFLQKGSLSHFTVITRRKISPGSRGVVLGDLVALADLVDLVETPTRKKPRVFVESS